MPGPTDLPGNEVRMTPLIPSIDWPGWLQQTVFVRSPASPPAFPTPTVWYRFNGTNRGSLGAAGDLTPTGAVTTGTGYDGTPGAAIQLAADGSSFLTGSQPVLTATTFTIVALRTRVADAGQGNSGPNVGEFDAGFNFAPFLTVAATEGRAGSQPSGGEFDGLINTQNLAADTWAHDALTSDGVTWTLYRNGVERASGPAVALLGSPVGFFIANVGKAQNVGAFVGTVLTPTQIGQLAAGLDPAPAPTGPVMRGSPQTGIGGDPTLPALAAGDTLVVAGVFTGNPTAPGWTKTISLLDSSGSLRLIVFTKTAVGNETTLAAGANPAGSWIAVSYQDSAGVDSSASGTAGTATAPVCPDVTVVEPPVVLLDFILAYEGDSTAPAVTVPAGEDAVALVPDGPNLLTLALGTKKVSGAGATGTRTAAVAPASARAVGTVCVK